MKARYCAVVVGSPCSERRMEFSTDRDEAIEIALGAPRSLSPDPEHSGTAKASRRTCSADAGAPPAAAL